MSHVQVHIALAYDACGQELRKLFGEGTLPTTGDVLARTHHDAPDHRGETTPKAVRATCAEAHLTLADWP